MIAQQIKNYLPFDDQNYLMVEYPDYFSPQKNKKAKVKDLGQKFASVNSFFYNFLKEYQIPCAYVKEHQNNTLVYVKFQQLPFSIKIFNASDRRTAKLFSIKEGLPLEPPIIQYHFGTSKNSLVSESHLIAFDLCTVEDLKLINRICSKVNAVLKAFFERRNETVAEFTCSFGRHDGKIYLVDDFSPLSLKVFPNRDTNGWVNPYSLNTSSEMRKYTDFLFNLTNA